MSGEDSTLIALWKDHRVTMRYDQHLEWRLADLIILKRTCSSWRQEACGRGGRLTFLRKRRKAVLLVVDSIRMLGTVLMKTYIHNMASLPSWQGRKMNFAS